MKALKPILYAGMLVGVLDITAACINARVLAGVTPPHVLQSVAGGLLGRGTYNGGFATAALGLAMHFTMALTVAAIFYALSRRFSLPKNLLGVVVVGMVDSQAGTHRNLALVQRHRGRNSFAVCNYDIQDLSQAGSAAVTKCACYRGRLLPVWAPGSQRVATPVLQHRNTGRVLAVLHRHRRAPASRYVSVCTNYSTAA